MRQPITTFMRTAEEVQDIQLSWARPDIRFFSSGACHILAFVFLATYPQAGFQPWFIRPAPGFRGSHLYVSNGERAFDAQGYVLADNLVQQHYAALTATQPGWQADVFELGLSLAEFCALNNHCAPEDFPGDVWHRAQRYVTQFPAP
ncbi:hypothetical protein GO986_07850 [Deinococcus sp. HMF7620]|uniref:Uncharacterized protein n=1 Tax=Deinococcus arboris TaxID=2682977 RepID=A0A7C9HZ57_9DEIO|nr:hypothetical protein [Deinococcus arboris]MVN86675.1 hypothetical protein [Deinococcus arboris]